MTTDVPRWKVIRSKLPRPHVVYYNAYLPDGRRVSVSRIYNEDHTWNPNGKWRWTVWKKEPANVVRGTPEQQGEALTASLAKFKIREVTGVYIRSR